MSNGIQGKEQENKFFTVEFFGVTLIISSFLLLVCLLFGYSILFELGEEIQFSLYGLFGYFSYPLLVSLNVIGFMMLFGKKPSKSSIFTVLKLVYTLVLVLCLFTVITNLKYPNSFSEYLSNAYTSGRLGIQKAVVGGAFFSIITYPAVYYIGYVWSIVLFSALLLLNIVLAFNKAKRNAKNPPQKAVVTTPTEQAEPREATQPTGYQAPTYVAQPPYGAPPQYGAQQPQYVEQPPYGQGVQPQYPPQGQAGGYGHGTGYYGGFTVPQSQQQPYFNAPSREEAMRILYGGPKTYSNAYNAASTNGGVAVGGESNQNGIPNSNGMISSPIPKDDAPKYTFEDRAQAEPFEDGDDYIADQTGVEGFDKYKPQESAKPSFISNFFKTANSRAIEGEEGLKEPTSKEPEFDEFEEPTFEEPSYIEPVFDEEPIKKEVKKSPIKTQKPLKSPIIKEVNPIISENEEAILPQEDLNSYSKYLIENMPVGLKYTPPPISLLNTVDKSADDYEYKRFKFEVENRILETLDNFGIKTQIARSFRGPAVTRFDVEVPSTVSMSRVTKLQNDINLRVAASSPLRMVAPVTGTSYVGFEVPNKTREMVSLREIVTSQSFLECEDYSLTFALGKDVIGNPISLDLAKMPHLLVTGTTGSGKSVCLNTLIISLMMKYSPEELRFIMVDPKAVEFTPYAKIPHLYFGEIIKDDVALTNAMLAWTINEMERRYEIFSKLMVRDIKAYNKKAKGAGEKIIPRLVLIIDEFADIMLKDKNGVNTKICQLAQKSRAAGIHLVLAAQRPSVDIIGGPIKANLPSRIVFRATSQHDSMTSLGEIGAEKLLGRGDCLYIADGMPSIERAMGAYVSDDEIYTVANYIAEHNTAYYDYNAWARIVSSVTSASEAQANAPTDLVSNGAQQDANYVDPLHVKAMEIGYNSGGLSTSFLQRRLGVGYPRAAKIIDWLTDNGYITPNSISGKKQMILPKEEFEEKFGIGGGSGAN